MRLPSKRPLPIGSDRLPVGMRFSVALALVILTIAGAAFSQPRRPKPFGKPPKVEPSATTAADAGPANAPGANAASTASSDSGSMGVPDPGTAPLGDGGVRPSPLNPAASEFPSRGADAGPPLPGPDYDRLLADVAALRARIASAQDALFRSRVAVSIKLEGKHAKLARLSVSLDDGAVYAAPQGFHPDDYATVYDHAVAPGKHAITVDIDRRDDRDDAFRTVQRSRVIVDVPKEQRLDVQVLLVDDSDMGGDFPSDKSGRYDLRVRFKAVAKGAK
ncbi:MAG: hypothetical protein U0174_13665 [Polyangiaceae bacterium]